MTDPAFQFQAAGFDSPEVAQQIAAAFEEIRAAFAVFTQACAALMEQIAEAIQPLLDAIVRLFGFLRWWNVPRNERMTIMRCKIRRYMQMRT